MLVSSDKGDPLCLSDAVAGNMQRKDKVYLAMGRGFQVNFSPSFFAAQQQGKDNCRSRSLAGMTNKKGKSNSNDSLRQVSREGRGCT